MSAEVTRKRIRPLTTSNIQRLNKSRPTSSTTPTQQGRRRNIRSAKARLGRTKEDPPPDLIPPEYSPMLCEMNIGPLSPVPSMLRRPDSGYDTQDGGCGGARSDDDDEDDGIAGVASVNTPGPLSGKFSFVDEFKKPEEGTSPVEFDYHSRPVPKEPPKLPTERPKTTDQLKSFLAAAMDSVRFFLVTSSIASAANKQNADESESESEEESEPALPGYNRSKLLIMNGALMDPPWRFSIETYKDDPDMLEFYTGFRKYDLIKSVFNLIKPSADTVAEWIANDSRENIRDSSFKTGVITQFEEFFLFLYKLRHNPSGMDLSIRFSMPEETVQHVLDDWMHYLYVSFGRKAIWPTRDNVDMFMQRCYKSVCPCARIVVHVAKVKVRQPRQLTPAADSSYKSETESDATGGDPADNHADSSKEASSDATTKDQPAPTQEKQKSDNKWSILAKRTQTADRTASPSPQSRRHSTAEALTQSPKTSRKHKPRQSLAHIVHTPRSSGRRQSVKPKSKKEFLPGESDLAELEEQAKKRTVVTANNKPLGDDTKHYKSVVIFQPTGAACMVSALYPLDTPAEQIISQMGVLELLDECDDVVTVDEADDLNHNAMEELLHPYAANYMNLNFLTGCMPMDEFRRKSPMKAHRVKCMRWHIYQSIEWVQKMKIWDDLAELPQNWVDNVERIWTISYLLTNFLPADPCLDVDAS